MIIQPSPGRPAIITAVPVPLSVDFHMTVELIKQIPRGHVSTSKEKLGHPVVITFGDEWIRFILVDKNMNERLAVILQPA